MMRLCVFEWFGRNKARGQGLVEYSGALVIAGLIISGLVFASQDGNWLNNAYDAIVTAAANMLVGMASQIG